MAKKNLPTLPIGWEYFTTPIGDPVAIFLPEITLISPIAKGTFLGGHGVTTVVQEPFETIVEKLSKLA